MSILVTIRHITGSLAGKSQRVAMQEGQVLRLGRADDNDIKFTESLDDSVSGYHAEISLQDQRLQVEDKRSSNGTFLNGAPCPPFQKLAVPDGSRLRLAQQGPEMQLTVESVAPRAPAAPAPEAPAPPAVKDGIGKTTLLREIDRARHEERGLLHGELERTRKSGAVRLGFGLAGVLLLGGLGIAAGLWWNADKARAAEARIAQDQAAALEKAKNVWSEVESKVNPTVVQVVCNYRLRSLLTLADGAQVGGKEFTGGVKATGVQIRPGLILTALHAVEPWKYNLVWNQLAETLKPEYDSLEVQFPGFQPINATVEVGSQEFDLALLRVAQTQSPSIEMGQTNGDVAVTQRIAVLGYPGQLGQYELKVSAHGDPGQGLRTRLELNPTFVYGAVAQPLTGAGSASHFLYFDGTISPGNSGGPVVNDRGQLIGIVTTRFDRPGTLFTFLNRKIQSRLPVEPSNFAVSPDDIRTFLRQHGLL